MGEKAMKPRSRSRRYIFAGNDVNGIMRQIPITAKTAAKAEEKALAKLPNARLMKVES